MGSGSKTGRQSSSRAKGKMPRPTRGGHRPKSDTMLLRRLINNLKERGSEVAEELERKAHNFLTDVKSKKKPALQTFESDDEDSSFSEWEEEEEAPFSLPPPPARLSLPICPGPPPPRQATPPPPSPPTPVRALPTPPITPEVVVEAPSWPVQPRFPTPPVETPETPGQSPSR